MEVVNPFTAVSQYAYVITCRKSPDDILNKFYENSLWLRIEQNYPVQFVDYLERYEAMRQVIRPVASSSWSNKKNFNERVSFCMKVWSCHLTWLHTCLLSGLKKEIVCIGHTRNKLLYFSVAKAWVWSKCIRISEHAGYIIRNILFVVVAVLNLHASRFEHLSVF